MMKTPGMSLMDDKKYINYTCLLQYFFFFFFLEMWISVSEVYMEFVRLNGTNRASVSALLLRAAMTSELKELHCVKRPFKNREKWKRRGWNKNQTSDPCGARTFGATSNWKKNPLSAGEEKQTFAAVILLYSLFPNKQRDCSRCKSKKCLFWKHWNQC